MNNIFKYELLISYNQIAVFNTNLENPFNDWNDTHVAQGFSWRKESVSFGTITNEEAEVQVELIKNIEILNSAIRIIRVPFEITDDTITIASIGDSFELELDKGKYNIIFTVFKNKEKDLEFIYKFSFIKNDNDTSEILKIDNELNPPKELLMIAKPAI